MTETEIMHSILCEVTALEGAMFWRNNTGSATTRRGEFIRFGCPGSPDIIGTYRGRAIGIEVKSAKGRLSERQKAWIDRMATYGFNTHVCRSVDDVLNALAHEGLPNIVRFA